MRKAAEAETTSNVASTARTSSPICSCRSRQYRGNYRPQIGAELIKRQGSPCEMPSWPESSWRFSAAAVNGLRVCEGGPTGVLRRCCSARGRRCMPTRIFCSHRRSEVTWETLVNMVDDYFRMAREEPVRIAGNVPTEGTINHVFPRSAPRYRALAAQHGRSRSTGREHAANDATPCGASRDARAGRLHG